MKRQNEKINKIKVVLNIIIFLLPISSNFFSDFRKLLRKAKNVEENDFLMIDFPMKNMKENEIQLKLVKNLCSFKLFNLSLKVGK